MNDSCKATASYSGDSVLDCRGASNNRLRITDQQSTMRLELLDAQGAAHALHTPNTRSVGDIAEWYGRLRNGKLKPEMLIVRMLEQSGVANSPPVSNLLVVRLDRGNTCPVARVSPASNQNQIAREMARTLHDAPCLKEIASN
jgi:hypothetical protein